MAAPRTRSRSPARGGNMPSEARQHEFLDAAALVCVWCIRCAQVLVRSPRLCMYLVRSPRLFMYLVRSPRLPMVRSPRLYLENARRNIKSLSFLGEGLRLFQGHGHAGSEPQLHQLQACAPVERFASGGSGGPYMLEHVWYMEHVW